MAHAAIHIHTYVQVCHAHTIKKNKKSQNMRSTHIAYYLCTIQIRLYVFLQRGASILSLGSMQATLYKFDGNAVWLYYNIKY